MSSHNTRNLHIVKGPWFHNDFAGAKFFGNCDKWDAILEAHRTRKQLEEIEAKIQELQKEQQQLQDYLRICNSPGAMMAFGRMVTSEAANHISNEINKYQFD